jgi:hypothetical protein
MTEQEVRSAALKYQEELDIPVVLPLEDGVDALVPLFKKMIKNSLAQA